MNYYIVGLGNPGIEYQNTRHNAGRLALEYFASKNDFPNFQEDGKSKSLISKSKIEKNSVILIEPNNFMNNSGSSVSKFVKSKKDAGRTVVVYDDVDLKIGDIRIAFNRGSGGHRGVESITKHLKTREFIRIRIGVSPTTPMGKIKKPKGEEKVLKFLMSDFKTDELKVLEKVFARVSDALNLVIKDGLQKAMNQFN